MPLRGAIWMSGAILSFTAMAIAGRALSKDLDTFEIMFYRSVIGFFALAAIITALRKWKQFETDNLGLHFIRNFCHFTGQNLWFYALPLIPLAQVFALEFTSPLWVLVLSPLLLGERLTQLRILAAVIGFVGILIVARPSPDTLNAGTIAAALSAIGFAGSAIFTKQLTRRVSLISILMWMTIMQSLFGLICAGFDGDIALPVSSNILWLLLVAAGGLLAHLCLTTALSMAPAVVVMPVDFIRLPVIALIGWLFYAEGLDIFVFIGAILIFGANYLNIWFETRKTP